MFLNLNTLFYIIPNLIKIETVFINQLVRYSFNQEYCHYKYIVIFLFQLDEEIEMLSISGVKNQTHTLKLSRLMVRAKELPPRMQLLKLLYEGEEPCRRLFLDYHGLRLIHGWMSDASSLKDTDNLLFRLVVFTIIMNKMTSIARLGLAKILS